MRSETGLNPLLVLILAPLAGALVTLSLAPFDVWPAGIISCALYAWLLSTCSPRQALWRGFLYGCGMFGTGVSWIFVSIHVHGNANVPLAEMFGYVSSLRSLTQGRATYVMEFSHYNVVPEKVSKSLISNIGGIV